jgi:outer membrane immunogenic protein
MKKLLLATSALCFGAVPTMAADLPIAAKAPPAIVNSWAGFYLGFHGGYGWGNNDFSVLALGAGEPPMAGIKSRGALFGAQAGYNWQFGRAVGGVELDFSGADIRGSNTTGVTIPGVGSVADTREDRIRYLGTARARLGWLPTNNVLLYGTAGLGWERVDRTETLNETAILGGIPFFVNLTTQTPFDHFGWVAGAGAEVALWNTGWTGRLEYLHYDFGGTEPATTFVIAPPGVSQFDRAGRQTIDSVRAGLSYKFGVLGPAAPSPLYTKAPAAPVLASSWAGFYLGVHGGYGWGHDPFSKVVFFDPLAGSTFVNGVNSAGWLAGGHAGYNWQFNRVVTGLELDLSGADVRGSSTAAIPGSTFTLGDRIKYLGTARARLGWLPTPGVLLYGTAGLAWERIEASSTEVDVGGGFTTTSTTITPADRFGWVAGLGGESLLFGTNWIGRLEYLHYDFGATTSTLAAIENIPGANFAVAEHAGRQTIDVIRAGASYKFGDPAIAASLPYTKAPPTAVASAWTGFYLGVHGGYGWKSNDFSFDFAPDGRLGGIDSRGWVGGGQAGYNWQYGRAVAGLEADFSATGIKGTSAPLLNETLSDDVKYLGTARGRLGWLPVESVLLYGTAGLAWERVDRTDATLDLIPPPTFTAATTARDHFGWVAGIGAETMLWNSGWVGRLEYLHYDFGTVEATSSRVSNDPAALQFADQGGHQTIDVLRAGVSYKFGANGPVVAKY